MSTVSAKWVTIDDFSPGIYSAGSWRIAGAATAGGIVPGAPLGSAQETDTYRCVPTANGRGLMPAPRGTDQTFDRTILSGTPGSVTHAVVTGLTAYPGETKPYGFVFGFWTFQSGDGTREYIIAPTTLTGVMSKIVHTSNNALGADATTARRANCFARTTVNHTTPYLTPGEYAIFYTGTSTSATRFTDNTSADVQAWAFSLRMIAHQNRIVGFRPGQAIFNIANMMSSYGNMAYRMLYSQPANSNVFPTTEYTIEAEDRTGVYAMSALNANTLLLVKGGPTGGLIVQGDIANPIVTAAPGITGANTVTTDAGVGPLGAVYASGGQGVHAWSGGATSTKISKQLRDDFFRTSAISDTLFEGMCTSSLNVGLGWAVSTRYWNDYIMVTNGWMFHIPSGGWWRIEPTSTMQQMYWEPSYWPNYIMGTYATEFTSLSANVTWGRLFDNTLGATNWSWQSQPIPVTIDRHVMVSELVVTAQGAGTIVFTGRGYDGTSATVTSAVTVTLPAEAANQPVKVRVPFAIDGYNIIIKMVADNGSNTAPTVNRLDIGYDDGNLVAVQ